MNSQLINDTSNSQTFKSTHFNFSGTKLEALGASEYTLVQITIDVSGSTKPYRPEMEAALKEIITACRDNDRSENLLIRIVLFSNNVKEVIGWTPVFEIKADGVDGLLTAGGATALYDSSINSFESLDVYAGVLKKQDYIVNGICFVLTDGAENESKFVSNAIGQEAKYVKESLQKLNSNENLESVLTFLVAINNVDPANQTALNDFNKQVGFDHYLNLSDANANTLQKLAKFVSESISSQSKALGSGLPSQTIPTF